MLRNMVFSRGVSRLGLIATVVKKYFKFVGPGIMVSVAYMDPGNYSTAVAAGSAYKYNLLFSILLSNCLAVFLQVLSAKLGAITGLDLAANCRANLGYKINIFLYILAEIAIIATDVAEVVGTAIALNIIFHLPLFAGVIFTVLDILIVLMAYRPNGSLFIVRLFESFVSLLVCTTVVCFGIELFQVSKDPTIDFSYADVLKGFLPNSKVVDMGERKGGSGLYLSLAILGATVMPHSLYLGSGLVQVRLKDHDIKNGHYKPKDSLSNSVENDSVENELQINGSAKLHAEQEDDQAEYRPSIHAIKETMSYTIAELVVSLFTVALFVNSAILIVAGATLNSSKFSGRDNHSDGNESDDESDDEDNYQNADLFTIYKLLSDHLSPTAGFIFALALLCSGQSAGIVCTLAGQMVSEGFLSWTIPPVARRLITRGLAIAPCLIVVSLTGRDGLSSVLNMSQVILAILLPVVIAPLIWFTCSSKYMSVPIYDSDLGHVDEYLPLDDEDSLSRSLSPDTTMTLVKQTQKKYKVNETSIRLKTLKNSTPCNAWDEGEEFETQGDMNEPSSTNGVGKPSTYRDEEPQGRNINEHENLDDGATTIFEDDGPNIIGYKDMSNGKIMSSISVLIWIFISGLNLYLIFSMVSGDSDIF